MSKAENPMEALSLRVWKDLGVVDTIFEEGEEPSTTPSLSPLLSPSLSPSSTPLHSLVEAWSLASGDEIDVVIHVEDSCFYLHKAPLRARSGYMKRQLKESSELNLSPPLSITAETFTLVTEFCYGAHIVLTPFNIAPLRVAAELLDMTESNGTPNDNLRQKTETYFRRAVAVNEEHATIVLRSSVSLLPEAETAACLVSRCIEALMVIGDVNETVVSMSCLKEVLKLTPKEFQVVLESMNQRLTCHDILYRIIDLYLKGNIEKITEEQKIGMCNYIDCTILSSQVLMHAVQNPRMPLRFVVQAMFVEQLNTRRSIFFAAGKQNLNHENEDPSTTLGAILQRDAALRQVAQLKAAMDTTNSRIQSLEKELSGMKKRLEESENSENNTLDSGRSQSFRLSSENKIERGQIGSVSSASFLSINRNKAAGSSSSDQESCDRSPLDEKKLGRRFINGLKSAFRVPKKKMETNIGSEVEGKKAATEKYGHVVVIKKDFPYQYNHR